MRESIEILDFKSQGKLDLSCLGFLYTRCMDIGQWVKQCRLEAKLTQTELGEKLSVSKGNVSAWETNKHEPSYAQMVEIAKASRFSVPLPGVKMPSWPFKEVTPEQFARLSEADRAKIEERALMLIESSADKSPTPDEAAAA